MSHYVSIFGSCRQTAISSHVHTTDILDHLNYPHYTSEALHQIRYLKYGNIPEEHTKYCFRSGLITRCSSTISKTKYAVLKTQYDNTTIFLIEIASRLSYKWNNLYMHHIAIGKKHEFYDKDKIEIRELLDEEIEEDIVQIRNELYPKPFILISHFATYTHGKRYELVQLLNRICTKYNIPFLNQSDVVSKYGTQILCAEPVLSHYTPEGHTIIGKWLMDKIIEVSQPSTKKLYQVYYTSEERVKKYTFHGFGDYIRGIIHLYQRFANNAIPQSEWTGSENSLLVNFSNHHLSTVFVCNNHLSIDESEKTKYIFVDDHDNFLHYKHVFTNKHLITPTIDDACKSFIIRNCFIPTIRFEKRLTLLKRQLSIVDKEYSIIHIRAKDNESFSQNRLNTILHIVSGIIQSNLTEKLLLVSNSHVYLQYIDSPFITKTNLSRGHVGQSNTSISECEDTMIEFMLMTTCKQIYQLSVYSWGSGFSDTAHKIYDVPLVKYSI